MFISDLLLHVQTFKVKLKFSEEIFLISDLPPPRKRPQTFSPSMEDLRGEPEASAIPYALRKGHHSSHRFHHSENELGDDEADESG
jgi:hypothetical protein